MDNAKLHNLVMLRMSELDLSKLSDQDLMDKYDEFLKNFSELSSDRAKPADVEVFKRPF